jgi:TRAP-type C4-dicarboxylate transport system permease small subunit
MTAFSFIVAKFGAFFFAADPVCTAAQKDALYGKHFFFFDPWWKYLNSHQDALGNCVPNVNLISHPSNLWLIGLAILDMLLRLAGFLAVLSIMLAGLELVRTEGNTEKATNARQRLLNSVLGLAIAASATALVAFVGNTVNPAAGSGLPHTLATQGAINGVLNAAFVIIGALAVLYIVLAGFRMITSGDNPTKVAESRKQILFALVGLIIVAIADALVNLVLGRLHG